MLRTLTDLEDYSIGATDGDIGRVKDYYFDDAGKLGDPAARGFDHPAAGQGQPRHRHGQAGDEAA
jgi:hypothetical protein